MNNRFHATDILVSQFLEKAESLCTEVELIRVLKSRTYKIGDANVLIRASMEGKTGKYFFGLNYITAEELANLDNPFIAFVCGSVDRTVMLPAKLLFQHFPQISHDRNGEYKITINRDLNLALKGRGNRVDCSPFINGWNLLLAPPLIEAETRNTVEESLHSVLQGRLIEIGNIRGYQTYCPDKSRKFNDRKLDELTTLKDCPKLQFSDYSLLRQIDVLWFRPKGENLIPEYAFEVELSTGVWSGVGRMATLIDYANVGLYVIANDAKRYNQVISSLHDIAGRYKFIANDLLSDLYAAELNLKKLRIDVGL